MNEKIILAFILILFTSGCISNVTADEAEDGSLIKLQEKGIIVVGTFPRMEPMTFIDEGENFAGFDIDLIKEIASEIGIEVEIKNIYWPDIFTSIEDESIDVAISSITITPERAEKYLFSSPYFGGGQVVIVKDPEISSLEELYDKRVGVISDSTSYEAIVSCGFFNTSLIKFYEEEDGFVEDGLENGEIDSMVVDYVIATGLVKNHPSLRILGKTITDEYYGIMTKAGNNELIEEINRILREMKRNRKIRELENKWLT